MSLQPMAKRTRAKPNWQNAKSLELNSDKPRRNVKNIKKTKTNLSNIIKEFEDVKNNIQNINDILCLPEDELDDEATEVFCFGVSTLIFDICRPVASHSPL